MTVLLTHGFSSTTLLSMNPSRQLTALLARSLPRLCFALTLPAYRAFPEMCEEPETTALSLQTCP